MNYRQTLEYLFAQLPMYQRIGPAAYKANLNNTLALSHYLGNPENTFPSIHIAGTNGKGSVSHMLAAILQKGGFRTGLATSPHLKDFRERIRVNGRMIAKSEVTEFVRKHRHFFEPLNASLFEISIALTFDCFSRSRLDMAVIETGLGGRLDSTNIVMPELSVITNIGLDHTALLGGTLQAIAGEKAGIIKPGVPVLIGRRQQQTKDVFQAVADRVNAPLYYAEDLFQLVSYERIARDGCEVMVAGFNAPDGSFQEYVCDLSGHYQAENLGTVLSAIYLLREKCGYAISQEAVVGGLGSVAALTGLKGRWQRLRRRPPVIADTAHNADGVRRITEQLSALPFNHLHMVWGMVNDKDPDPILALLPADATYYFCRPDVPRGLDAGELASRAASFGLNGRVYDSVAKAYADALRKAGRGDWIYIGGSTFVVAEVV